MPGPAVKTEAQRSEAAKDQTAGQTLKKIFRQDDRLAKVQEQTADRSLLMNPVRLSIFTHLCDNPCDHTRAIARAIGKSLNSINWNLGQLVEGGILESRELEGRRIFWPAGMLAKEDSALISMLRTDWAVPVLKAIKKHGGNARQRDIVRELGAGQQNVNVWLKKLLAGGVITSAAEGAWTAYSISSGFISRFSGYERLARERARDFFALLAKDGLMPRNARLRGTRLAIDIRLPSGYTRIHLECNPMASARKFTILD